MCVGRLQVDEWYRERERGEPANTTRRVFIASDDPRVLQQAKTKYVLTVGVICLSVVFGAASTVLFIEVSPSEDPD